MTATHFTPKPLPNCIEHSDPEHHKLHFIGDPCCVALGCEPTSVVTYAAPEWDSLPDDGPGIVSDGFTPADLAHQYGPVTVRDQYLAGFSQPTIAPCKLASLAAECAIKAAEARGATVVSNVNAPVLFSGSEDERRVNRASHHFSSWGDPEETPECVDCCTKAWHVAADYPCGVEVPRVWRTRLSDGTVVEVAA